MRRAFLFLNVSCLFLLSSCGGEEAGREPDVTPETTADERPQGSLSCLELGPGMPCTDNDNCTKGEGFCNENLECEFPPEQVLTCDDPPSECMSKWLGCSPEWECLWGLADGWCLIDDECVPDGAQHPDNPCLQCDSASDRGGWTPVSGPSCKPEANPCTTEGKCVNGLCTPVASGVECAKDSDCIAKDNGNLCDGIYICESCSCVLDTSSIVTCDPSQDTDCVSNKCNPDTGTCVLTPAEDGSPCEDGDPCTFGDYCFNGECVAGEAKAPIWTPSQSVDSAWINALAVVKSTPPVIYAVGSGGVVYSSKDLGTTFTPSELVATGTATGDWLFTAEGSGAVVSVLAIFTDALVVSNDGGFTYNVKLTGCTALARRATSPSSFVAVCNKQIYTSENAGASWVAGAAVPGLESSSIVALGARDANVLFAGTADEDSQGRGYLYMSQDGGLTWNKIDPPERPDLARVSKRGILVHPQALDKVFVGYATVDGKPIPFASVGIFRSDDGGMSFVPLNPSNQNAHTFVPITLDSAGRLILGVNSGITRGSNFGEGPWGPIPAPEPPSQIRFHTIHSAIIDPTSEFSFFLPAANGIAHANQFGSSWTLKNKGLNGGLFPRISACGNNTLIAQDTLGSAVFTSHDSGKTWKSAAPSADAIGRELTALGCAPGNTSLVYGFASDGSLAVSVDGGTSFTWQTEQTGPQLSSFNAIASSPINPNFLIVSRLGMGAFTSLDGGIAEGSGFEPASLPSAYVASLAADPTEPGRFWAGSFATPEDPVPKVFTCTDSGAKCVLTLEGSTSWTDGETVAFMVHPDPELPGRVFAAVSGRKAKIYFSNDYGKSWGSLTDLPFLCMRGNGELLPLKGVKGSLLAAFRFHPLVFWSELDKKWTVLEDSPLAVSSLAYTPGDDGTILAGSSAESRIYSSKDSGATWTVYKDFGLTDFSVARIVTSGEVIFALLEGKAHNETKLFMHSGVTWKELPVGTAVNDVQMLQGSGTILAAAKFGGVYASLDGGATFAPTGDLDSAAIDLLAQSGDDQVVFAAVECGMLPSWYDSNETFLGSDCGVKRSMDGGKTWFTVLKTNKPCVSLASLAENPDLVLAACPGAGVYVTRDGGSSWENLSGSPLLSQVTSIALHGTYLLLGTQTNGIVRGEIDPVDWSIGSWDNAFSSGVRGLVPVSQITMAVEPGNSSRIIVSAIPGGVVRTDDFGQKWRSITGRLAPDVDSLEGRAGFALIPRYANSAEGNRLWLAVGGRGIYTSLDHGARLLFASPGSLPVTKAHPVELVTHPEHQGWLWLATREGLFRTSDSGATWIKIGVGLPAGPLESLVPPNNGNLYTSVPGAGIYYLPFDGASWKKAHFIDFYRKTTPAWPGRRLAVSHSMLTDPFSSKVLLVGTDPFGLFRSQDGGVSFQRIGAGLPVGPIYTLARSPEQATDVFAATAAGIFVSHDNGETFAPAGVQSPGWCISLAFDAAGADTIYALCADEIPHGIPEKGSENGYSSCALHASYDGGETWHIVAPELVPDRKPQQILADPVSPGVLFLITAEGGVLRSKDGGIEFSPWNAGLPCPTTAGLGRLHAAPAALTGNSIILGSDGFSFFSRVLSACE